MKAIIINPQTKEITEQDIRIDSFEDHYKIMECDLIEPFRPILGHCLWVDEEGLFKRNLKPFIICEKYFVGKAILLAGNYGTKDCKVSLDYVKSQVRFI